MGNCSPRMRRQHMEVFIGQHAVAWALPDTLHGIHNHIGRGEIRIVDFDVTAGVILKQHGVHG